MPGFGHTLQRQDCPLGRSLAARWVRVPLLPLLSFARVIALAFVCPARFCPWHPAAHLKGRRLSPSRLRLLVSRCRDDECRVWTACCSTRSPRAFSASLQMTRGVSMSRSIYSHAMTCRNRLFVSALGALVLILGSTIWSPAFAWDPYIGPEITTLPPEFRDDPNFSAIPVKWQWSYTFRHLLDNGSVESAGYAAGEKVNFRVRSYATGIGSVRLELTGSQTA